MRWMLIVMALLCRPALAELVYVDFRTHPREVIVAVNETFPAISFAVRQTTDAWVTWRAWYMGASDTCAEPSYATLDGSSLGPLVPGNVIHGWPVYQTAGTHVLTLTSAVDEFGCRDNFGLLAASAVFEVTASGATTFAVPEPSSLWLAVALLGLGRLRRW